MLSGKCLSSGGLLEKRDILKNTFKDVLDFESSPYPAWTQGSECHGMKTNPTGKLFSTYEISLTNGYQDFDLEKLTTTYIRCTRF